MFFSISFRGTEELIKMAERTANLLRQNAETAVARTTLLGVARIANDCPVDTGRLRASIAGDYADLAGVDLSRGKISEGKKLSATKIRGMEGIIGTNVEYALYVEYGRSATGPKKLTAKQRRYLFAMGILKADSKGNVVPSSIHKRINNNAAVKYGIDIGDRSRNRVKGKGMFRKNIPILQRNLNEEMGRAISATKDGQLLREAI